MTNSWIRVASVLLALVLLMVAVTPAAASGGAGFAQPARHYIVWQKLCHDSVKVAPDGKDGSIAACIHKPGTPIGHVDLLADFCVPGTRYARLSKLIVMLACCGQSRRLVERMDELHVYHVDTRVFTDRPVSMKYRGVMRLDRRGVNAVGQKSLVYTQEFDDSTWKETYLRWLTKHGSKRR